MWCHAFDRMVFLELIVLASKLSVDASSKHFQLEREVRSVFCEVVFDCLGSILMGKYVEKPAITSSSH